MVVGAIAFLVFGLGSPAPAAQTYYAKGKELASFNLSPDGKIVRTGIRSYGSSRFIMSISGTLSSPGGRAADGLYLFQNPHQPESLPLPRWSPYVLYAPKDAYGWKDLPVDGGEKGRPAFNQGHSYEVVLAPYEDADMGFGTAESYWDYPPDKPKDYIKGTLSVKIYEAILRTGPPPPKLEALDAHYIFRSEVHPSRIAYPNSELAKMAPITVEALSMFRTPKELSGVAADGVSLVLLRAPATGAGPATLTLNGPGGLYPVSANPFEAAGKRSLIVTPQNKVENGKPEPWVFAIYRPTTYFGAGSSPRPVSITLEQTRAGKTEKIRSNVAFRLVRPPIVLVHGTYDNPTSCWVSNTEKIGGREISWPKSMTMRLKDEGFTNVFLVDWESTNGSKDPSDFKTNQKTVLENKNGIRDAVAAMRAEGIAVTQADLICHSQGGVISRVFAKGKDIDGTPDLGDPHYRDPLLCRTCFYHTGETFKMGYIHSLTTISSTHRGSDVCRLLEAYKKYKDGGYNLDRWWMGLFVWYVDNFESGITTGGFRDQTPGTDRLKKVGPTPVPSHAIAATAADEDMHEYGALYVGRLKKLWGKTPMDAIVFAMNEMGQPDDAAKLQKLEEEYQSAATESEKSRAYNQCLYALRAAVFAGDANDCTVALKSSLGGLTGPYATHCPRMLHGYAPRHNTVQDAVVKILNNGPDYLSPIGFPDSYTGAKATWRLPDADPNAPKPKVILEGPEFVPPNFRPQDPDIPKPDTKSVGSSPAVGGTAGLFNKAGSDGFQDAQAVDDPPFNPTWIKKPTSSGPSFNPTFSRASLDELRTAAESAPNDAGVQSSYAAGLIKAGQFEQAEAIAKAAVKLNKNDPAPRLILALALSKQGQYAKAEAHYRESLINDHQNPWAHAGLAACMVSQKKWAPAERSYREAVKLSPKQGSWQAEHALALYRLNRIPEAKTAALRARALGVKSHPVYKPLGIK